MPLKTGDAIWVTAGERKMEGSVMLASPNDVSLMVQMDGAIWINGGESMLAGSVPLEKHQDGEYHVLFDDSIIVKIEPR